MDLLIFPTKVHMFPIRFVWVFGAVHQPFCLLCLLRIWLLVPLVFGFSHVFSDLRFHLFYLSRLFHIFSQVLFLICPSSFSVSNVLSVSFSGLIHFPCSLHFCQLFTPDVPRPSFFYSPCLVVTREETPSSEIACFRVSVFMSTFVPSFT